MTFQGVIDLPRAACSRLVDLGQRFKTLTVRAAAIQGLVLGAVGLGLGGYILAISSLPLQWVLLLSLAVLCPFVLMIVGNIRRWLLAIVILDIPLQLDIYLNYRSDVADLGAFGGINFSITTAALIMLYALWFSRLLIRVEALPRTLLRSSFPLSLYLGCVVLSLAAARDVTLSLFQILFLGQTFLLYLYIANSIQTRQEVAFVINIFVICLAFESLIMLGVYLTGQDINAFGISTGVEAGFGERSGGTFQSPNNAAAYLSLLLVPGFSLLLTNSERGIKRLATLAGGVGVIALVLTLSRGGWAAFLLSGLIVCLAAWRNWFSPAMRVAVIMVAGLVALIFYIFIFSGVSRDDGGRLILMEVAFRMIEDYPWLGVGANNYVLWLPQYATPDLARAWLYTVHNMYLLVWAETGIGGLLAFVLFLVATIHRGWQCWKRQDRLLSPLALGFAAALIGHMVHMLFDLFNDRPNIQFLWLIAGLIFALNKTADLDLDRPAYNQHNARVIGVYR